MIASFALTKTLHGQGRSAQIKDLTPLQANALLEFGQLVSKDQGQHNVRTDAQNVGRESSVELQWPFLCERLNAQYSQSGACSL